MKLLNINNKTDKQINIITSDRGIGKTRCVVGGLVYPSLLEGKRVLFKTMGEMSDYEISHMCVEAYMKDKHVDKEEALNYLFGNEHRIIITDCQEYINIFQEDLEHQIQAYGPFDIIVIDHAFAINNKGSIIELDTNQKLLEILKSINIKCYISGMTNQSKEYGQISINKAENKDERLITVNGETIKVKCDFENCIVEEIE